jgi:hypothetical protein
MKVSWDDYSVYVWKNKNVPNHQAVMVLYWVLPILGPQINDKKSSIASL